MNDFIKYGHIGSMNHEKRDIYHRFMNINSYFSGIRLFVPVSRKNNVQHFKREVFTEKLLKNNLNRLRNVLVKKYGDKGFISKNCYFYENSKDMIKNTYHVIADNVRKDFTLSCNMMEKYLKSNIGDIFIFNPDLVVKSFIIDKDIFVDCGYRLFLCVFDKEELCYYLSFESNDGLNFYSYECRINEFYTKFRNFNKHNSDFCYTAYNSYYNQFVFDFIFLDNIKNGTDLSINFLNLRFIFGIIEKENIFKYNQNHYYVDKLILNLLQNLNRENKSFLEKDGAGDGFWFKKH